MRIKHSFSRLLRFVDRDHLKRLFDAYQQIKQQTKDEIIENTKASQKRKEQLAELEKEEQEDAVK